MTRLEAACGLAVLARELCESGRDLHLLQRGEEDRRPARLRAPRFAIVASAAARRARSRQGGRRGRQVRRAADRLHRRAVARHGSRAKGFGYMVNVAANQHGVGRGDWRRVDGFSEAVLSVDRRHRGRMKTGSRRAQGFGLPSRVRSDTGGPSRNPDVIRPFRRRFARRPRAAGALRAAPAHSDGRRRAGVPRLARRVRARVHRRRTSISTRPGTCRRRGNGWPTARCCIPSIRRSPKC